MAPDAVVRLQVSKPREDVADVVGVLGVPDNGFCGCPTALRVGRVSGEAIVEGCVPGD